MRSHSLLAAYLLIVAVVALGCQPQTYKLVVEADPAVLWKGEYEVAWGAGPGGGGEGVAISGAGDWETVVTGDQGAVRFLRLYVTADLNGRRLAVRILRGDDVLAEDQAEGTAAGASCTWGTP